MPDTLITEHEGGSKRQSVAGSNATSTHRDAPQIKLNRWPAHIYGTHKQVQQFHRSEHLQLHCGEYLPFYASLVSFLSAIVPTETDLTSASIQNSAADW